MKYYLKKDKVIVVQICRVILNFTVRDFPDFSILRLKYYKSNDDLMKWRVHSIKLNINCIYNIISFILIDYCVKFSRMGYFTAKRG